MFSVEAFDWQLCCVGGRAVDAVFYDMARLRELSCQVQAHARLCRVVSPVTPLYLIS